MISAEQLAALTAAAQLDASVTALRGRFPTLHFTECSDDDVSPRYRAAADTGGHALYYITGASGHCLEMTNDAAVATGILVAAKVDGD